MTQATSVAAPLEAATHTALEAGKHAVSFELNDDPAGQDFVGDVGYANALHLGLSVELGGCSLLAPVCSSWVWINRGTYENIKNKSKHKSKRLT